MDNTIGGTPQPNGWTDDWVTFFGERRLRHQLKLAGRSDLNDMGNTLIANLGVFFEGLEVRFPASLNPKFLKPYILLILNPRPVP